MLEQLKKLYPFQIQQQTGEWIDVKTGQKYSGVQRTPLDKPANQVQYQPTSLKVGVSDVLKEVPKSIVKIGQKAVKNIKTAPERYSVFEKSPEGRLTLNPQKAIESGLNVAPIGELENVAKALVNTKTIQGATKILKKMGIADDLITKYAPKFAQTKDINIVQKGLQEIQKVPKIIPKLPPQAISAEKGIIAQEARIKLYHGTESSVGGKIEKEGLRYGDFLTTNKQEALDYAQMRAKQKGTKPIVKEFEFAKNEVEFNPSTNEWQYRGGVEKFTGKYPQNFYKEYNDYFGSNMTAKEIDAQTDIWDVAKAMSGYDEIKAKQLLGQATKEAGGVPKGRAIIPPQAISGEKGIIPQGTWISDKSAPGFGVRGKIVGEGTYGGKMNIPAYKVETPNGEITLIEKANAKIMGGTEPITQATKEAGVKGVKVSAEKLAPKAISGKAIPKSISEKMQISQPQLLRKVPQELEELTSVQNIKTAPERYSVFEKTPEGKLTLSPQKTIEQGFGFMPMGEMVNVAKSLVNAKTIKATTKILKQMGIADDLITKYAPKFAQTKDINIIQKGLQEIQKAPKVMTKLNIPKQTINLERLNISKEAKSNITKIADQIKPELETIKGGVLKNEEVIEAAKASDILTKGASRQATLKSEAMLLKTRQQLAELAKQETITPEFVETLKIVKAEATQRGRELQALGIEADPVLGNIKSKVVKKLLEIGKKTDEIVEASKGIDFNNAQQVTDFYRKFVKPTLPELIDEYRYINLLSSPKTHIVNAFSNLLQVAGLRPATRLASGVVDNIATKLTGKAQEYYIRQVPAYYKGVWNSIGDATKGFIDALKGKTLVYRPDISRIPTNAKLLSPFKYIPRILEGSDIFFRRLAMGGEMEALLKTGTKEASAIQKAVETASELVFRKALDPSNKTGQGLVLSAVDKLTNAVYKLRNVQGVKWFVPFVQTPMNILKQGIEYSPLGISTLAKNTSKIEQLGKAMIGSTIFAGAGWLALQDRTTWAVPTSEKEKTAFYDAGMQPYSVKIGDKWISYSRLGPIAYPIAMAAAIKHYTQDNPKSVTDTSLEKTKNVLAGIVGYFADQSYLEGLGDFLDVARGDTTAISRIFSNVPSQLIPISSFQRWVSQLIDPIYRKAESGLSVEAIVQNLEKGIPFLSKKVSPYTTPTGEPSKRQFPLLNQVSPLGITKEKPEAKELFDLMQKTSKETKALGKEKEQLTESVEAEYNRLKTIPKEQAAKEFDEMIKANPEMAKKISSLIKEEQRGLNPKDELLLSLGVENGLRAKTIKDLLDKLKTQEEKSAYYDELIKKKIITKQVNEQLLKLLEE